YHRWGKDDVWWFAAPDGVVSVSVRGRFRANNSDAVRRAALAGHGIALLSHLLVVEDISAGRLRVLMPAFPPARPTAAVHRLVTARTLGFTEGPSPISPRPRDARRSEPCSNSCTRTTS